MTDASPARRRFSTGGRFEEAFGYSRALRTGDRILVSGCTSFRDGRVHHVGDAAAQMQAALDTAIAAVEALGSCVDDVVLTRMYVVNREDCDRVGKVHGQRLAGPRPVATMVLVAGLVEEDMLVEVELEARVGTGRPHTPSGATG